MYGSSYTHRAYDTKALVALGRQQGVSFQAIALDCNQLTSEVSLSSCYVPRVSYTWSTGRFVTDRRLIHKLINDYCAR